MELSKIPGYDRALRRGAELEENLRGATFSGLPEQICGIEVRPLTMRIVRRLKAVRSPFLTGGGIRGGDIVVFLWAISPGYELRTKKAREKAKSKLVERAGALPYRRALRGIRRYLFYAWMDRPPSRRGKISSGGGGATVAFEAAMIHHLASSYGWDDEAILDKPLRRLHQYLTMIRIENDPKAHVFNPIVSRLTRPLKKKYLK